MTRIMRDSTTAADIPLAGLDLVAGYGNGRFAWTAADWAHFPASMPRVRIDVLSNAPATCSVLDVETGDATPGAAPGWVKERLKAIPRAYCTIYCNRNTRPAVKTAMDAAQLRVGIDYQWWIATDDGTEVLPDMTGVVAVQYKGPTAASGPGHYDQSVVYDDAWHAPPPEPWIREAHMQAQQLTVAAGKLAKLLESHL